MKKVTILFLIGLTGALVGCDYTTKEIAKRELENQPSITLISGILNLTYTENRDVGFNLLQSIPSHIRHPLVLSFGLVLIPILVVQWYRRRSSPWYEQTAYAMLLAGAFGNVLERAFRGYVIDFIHVHYWPVFNVADICLTFGVACFLIAPLLFRNRSRPQEA